MEQTLKFKKLHESAQLPQQQTSGSAGYDLSVIDGSWIEKGQTIVFKTGIAVQIPQGYVGLLCIRSSLGFREHLRLSNSVGVIDADFEHEIQISLKNEGLQDKEIKDLQRVAQLLIVPCLFLPSEFVEDFDSTPTERVGGFGSTGAF